MPHPAEGKLSRFERRQRDEAIAADLFGLFNSGTLIGLELTFDAWATALASLRQRELERIASRLEKYESFLDEEECALVVTTLRAAAREVVVDASLAPAVRGLLFDGEPPAGAGNSTAGAKPKLMKTNIRLVFLALVVDNGISMNRARELIATECDVTVETVDAALGKHVREFCKERLRERSAR